MIWTKDRKYAKTHVFCFHCQGWHYQFDILQLGQPVDWWDLLLHLQDLNNFQWFHHHLRTLLIVCCNRCFVRPRRLLLLPVKIFKITYRTHGKVGWLVSQRFALAFKLFCNYGVRINSNLWSGEYFLNLSITCGLPLGLHCCLLRKFHSLNRNLNCLHCVLHRRFRCHFLHLLHLKNVEVTQSILAMWWKILKWRHIEFIKSFLSWKEWKTDTASKIVSLFFNMLS